MPRYEYRAATDADLEWIWNKDIAENPGDDRYLRWKKQFIDDNHSGAARTFVVVADGEPVGQGTLLFSPACRAISGRLVLADHEKTANINALRIEEKHEGQGHISKLVRLMERHAADQGYVCLTIGVDEGEARNRAIYSHWGYDRLVLDTEESGERVLYYAKDIG